MRRISGIAGAAVILALAAGSTLASTVIGLSVEDQARLSKYVVVGTVVAQQGVEHPENGLETAVTLRVRSVYKGDFRRGETLVFHTRSGELNGESSLASGEAELRTGQKALVFIEEVDGRLYNLGLSMGVWDVHATRAGGTVFTRAVRDGLEIVGEAAVERGPLTSAQMKARIAEASRKPSFDNPLLRERLESER